MSTCIICQCRATRDGDVCAACDGVMQLPSFHEDEPRKFEEALALMVLRDRNYNKVTRRRRERVKVS